MGFKGRSTPPRFTFSDGVRLARGKFANELLEKVAAKDPSYLSWLRKAAKNGDIKLADEEFYALVDAMEKFNIPEQ